MSWVPLTSFCALNACLLLVFVYTSVDARESRVVDVPFDPGPTPLLIDLEEFDRENVSLSSSAALLRRDACPDTFVLFGGPGTLEGKFQTQQFAPDFQGWTGKDFTDVQNAWRVSTFNAETLGGHGPGNRAMWAGYTAAEQGGWITPPGYGNSWKMDLQWNSGPLSDPSQGQTVLLDFRFHLDVEPGYDFVKVEYDSAGQWRTVLAMDGSTRSPSGEFEAPGTAYAARGARPIRFVGDDYGGSGRDEIVLRIRVESDAWWSDEDGHWDTDGAIQVDDIVVEWTDDGSSQQNVETFESNGPHAWVAASSPFAGDFSKVFPRFQDIDPCAENTTPVMTFIDDGTPPRNDILGRSTGGSLSPNWSYGVPGGWVVNYDGGLSYGSVGLRNGVISPPIAWDVPGECDDGEGFRWMGVEVDWWLHTPGSVLGIIGWRWSTDGGASWSSVSTFNLYPLGSGSWIRYRLDQIPIESASPPTHVQVVLQAHDLRAAYSHFPLDSSPSPVFDNVRVVKFGRLAPVFAISTIQDAFAFSGGWDVSTPSARADLDIPVKHLPYSPTGDLGPITAYVQSVLPGVEIHDVRLLWSLDRNPLFEDALREVPTRTVDANVDVSEPGRWYGEVVGSLLNGDPIEGWYDVGLPELDFFYPGDVLRYALQATDSQGRVFTVPADLSGLRNGVGHDLYWTVRGLPSLRDDTGTQPRLLIVQRAGDPVRTRLALGQLGLVEGSDYDFWLQRAAGIVNITWAGIGASGRGGATRDQLVGYESIVFLTGTRGGSWPLIGDGVTGDSSNEVELFTSWRELPGTRNLHLSGSDIAASLTLSASLQTFLQMVLGVRFDDTNVRDEIGGRQMNGVMPMHPPFQKRFVVHNACSTQLGPDSVAPLGNAWAAHRFLDASDAITEASASVLRVEDLAGDTKRTVLFPFGLTQLGPDEEGSTTTQTTAAQLLDEVLTWFGVSSGSGAATDTPSPRPLLSPLRAHPNPFNPRIEIALQLGRSASLRVEVFDLRGAKTATLFDGQHQAGEVRMSWDARDDSGQAVASGVYLLRATAEGEKVHEKVALIR
jgi:hypothetical protein